MWSCGGQENNKGTHIYKATATATVQREQNDKKKGKKLKQKMKIGTVSERILLLVGVTHKRAGNTLVNHPIIVCFT